MRKNCNKAFGIFVFPQLFIIFANRIIYIINLNFMNNNKVMDRAADNIRILAASMVEKARSGHPGGAMGGADFINVLFSEYLIFDPEQPIGR